MINIQQDAAILNKMYPNVPIPKIMEFLMKLVKQHPNLNDQQVVDLLKTVFEQLKNKKQQQQPQQPQTPFQGVLSQLPTGVK